MVGEWRGIRFQGKNRCRNETRLAEPNRKIGDTRWSVALAIAIAIAITITMAIPIAIAISFAISFANTHLRIERLP